MSAPILLGVLSVASAGFSVMSQISAAKTQQKIANAQAQTIKTEAALRQEDRSKQRQRVIASQRARAGVSGATVESFQGVFDSTAAQFANEDYVDQLNARLNADMKKAEGQNALNQGYAQAAGTALNTGLKLAEGYFAS